jgi:hypothetical protein
VLAVSIIRAMMEAASTSEMSMKFYWSTQHNNPEDSYILLEYMPKNSVKWK